jgi:lipoprotein-releasing system ATP-binding protein
MPTPIIQTVELNKFYRKPIEFQVLKDIALEIYENEFIAIVGASGSGKSTLLYVLSTMDTDYSGEIYFGGQLLKNKPRQELARLRNEHIGFVFQFHYLLPEFTVLENVTLPAIKLNRLSKQEIEKEAINILESLDLKPIIYKKASQLSGGQQQRVAIARALINKPKIIMGDEPTGNLDSRNTALVYQIFRELNQQYGQTFLIVTHDTHFANQADRIITLSDGRII